MQKYANYINALLSSVASSTSTNASASNATLNSAQKHATLQSVTCVTRVTHNVAKNTLVKSVSKVHVYNV